MTHLVNYNETTHVWIQDIPRGKRASIVIGGTTVLRWDMTATEAEDYVRGLLSSSWKVI